MLGKEGTAVLFLDIKTKTTSNRLNDPKSGPLEFSFCEVQQCILPIQNMKPGLSSFKTGN